MAPLATTVAATVALGVGLVLARSEQERRARRRALDRRLGLRPGEHLGEGLQRMALAQIELALELIGADDGDAADAERAVHETRKALKRLNALVGLLRGHLGDAEVDRAHEAVQVAAHRLSGARDAEVMLSTLDALVERHPKRLRRGGVRRLRSRLAAENARVQSRVRADRATRTEALRELAALRARVGVWSLPEDAGIELIEDDLRRLYRQGRQRRRRLARGHGEQTRAMHKWRKLVKDLRYGAEMLERRDAGGSVLPVRRAKKRRGGKRDARALRQLARRSDALGELLGQEHDLAVLAEQIREGRRRGRHDAWWVGPRSRRTLLKLIAVRRHEIRRRALADGKRLYATEPRKLVRRLRAGYRAGARRRLS